MQYACTYPTTYLRRKEKENKQRGIRYPHSYTSHALSLPVHSPLTLYAEKDAMQTADASRISQSPSDNMKPDLISSKREIGSKHARKQNPHYPNANRHESREREERAENAAGPAGAEC
jgi:hypothetical protein